MYPLRGDKDPAPRLHYCFLTAPPSDYHLFESARLELREGLRGWIKPISCKQKGTQKSFCVQESHRVLLSFKSFWWRFKERGKSASSPAPSSVMGTGLPRKITASQPGWSWRQRENIHGEKGTLKCLSCFTSCYKQKLPKLKFKRLRKSTIIIPWMFYF